MMGGGDSQKTPQKLNGFMPDSTDEDRWARLAAELDLAGSAPAPSDVAPIGDAPTKRRRRRRSRKPGLIDGANGAPLDVADNDEGPPPLPTAGDESDFMPDGSPKKRRRRRTRRKPGDESAEVNDIGATVAVDDADNNDDDAAEPVSVANLPSWQELIDGLYRP
jgi:hypothetical protein